MAPKKSTRAQLCITDVHGSDDTLQATASTAELTSPMVLPEAKIDSDVDNDLEDDLGGERI
jgi:hypothetical protein